MSLRFIIDGYNLLNHPHLNLKGKTVSPARAILFLIRRNSLTGSVKNKVTVVFDGYPPGGEDQPAEGDHERVVFSRVISADEKIKKIVEESAGRKEIVVVSDDKEIIFYIKSLGARAMGVEEFLKSKSSFRKSQKNQPESKLSFEQMRQVDQELKGIWLKDEGRETRDEGRE